MSPKSIELGHLAWKASNGAPRCFQPGSMPPQDGIAPCQGAKLLVSNHREILRLAQYGGFPAGASTETDQDAATTAVADVCWLRNLNYLERCTVAIVTMGAAGAVVMDFARALAYRVLIEPGEQEIVTRAGSGDRFLAGVLLFRHWAERAGLVLRATQFVGRWLGLGNANHQVRYEVMASL